MKGRDQYTGHIWLMNLRSKYSPVQSSYRTTRKRCEICSKLTIKTLQRRRSVFIANFKHISHLFLVLTLN